jgi:hypothetical protein
MRPRSDSSPFAKQGQAVLCPMCTSHGDLNAYPAGARSGSQRVQPPSDVARPKSDSSRRSAAPSSTQSDGHRHLWISLTRKRSLVQIQHGPRDFSKSRLPLGARLLRFCPISAGHGAGIPASAEGVPAVLVTAERLADLWFAWCGGSPWLWFWPAPEIPSSTAAGQRVRREVGVPGRQRGNCG